MSFAPFMNKALILSLAVAFASPAIAASPNRGEAHFVLLQSKDVPFASVTISGTCKSDDGSFFGGKKVEHPWSCTTDANGVCTAEITLLPRQDSDKTNPCRGTTATLITEPGTPAAKSSYFTFFANGEPHSYNLLQKGTSWKHGDYLFKSLANKDSFDAVAYRHAPDFYRKMLVTEADASGRPASFSTASAHIPESKDYPSAEYLRASIDPKFNQPSVQVVVMDTYIDFSFRKLAKATYPAASGSHTTTLHPISQNAICNLRDLFERKCTHTETVAFDLDMETVRQAAAAYRIGERNIWTFQITAQSGHERSLSLSTAEFKALVEALDSAAAKGRP